MHASVERIAAQMLPADQRGPRILATFESLPPGGVLEFVDDHDPLTLFLEFERRHAGAYRWQYLEQGPSQWTVRIGRPAAGGCGGGGCACRGG
jgi:uncharacterized protein (DUF2249 family)